LPTGTLNGYALKTLFPPGADHTYVTSSNGHVWPCWGRSAGGRQICSANGNTALADCLSQPNSEAGIDYFRTGVCHQTANRILLTSSSFVTHAWGYMLSVYRYGIYGREPITGQHYSPHSYPWPELHNCRLKHTHP